MRSGQLLLRPAVIGVRLRDVRDGYYTLWSAWKGRQSPEATRLKSLFAACGIPNGLDDGSSWPTATFGQLGTRVSEIETDFPLEDASREVLDLAAFILVHRRLAPALNAWNEIARTTVRSASP